MERQSKLLEPRAHCFEKPICIGLALKTDDHIIGITHDDHVAGGLMPSPAFGPQIQNVVQVDIGQERRNHRALSCPSLTDRYGSVSEYPRLQPFPDQADDALVADTMLNESDEPILTDRIERSHDRLPITKTFRFRPSSHANGIPLKGADFPSSR